MKFANIPKISLLTMALVFFTAQTYASTTEKTTTEKNNNKEMTNQTTTVNHTTTTNKTEKTISDSEINKNVKSALAADKITSDLKLNVTTKDGIVELSGNVNTDAEASKAIQLAESTPGVKNTDTSKLVVKESTQPFTDMAITAKVKGTFIREKLFGEKDISVMSVNVETTDGVVYLTGTVESKEEAENAIKLAKSISDVKNVESKLEIKPAE